MYADPVPNYQIYIFRQTVCYSDLGAYYILANQKLTFLPPLLSCEHCVILVPIIFYSLVQLATIRVLYWLMIM